MKLFLVRHGQTTANVDKIYAGQTDVMLTEAGREQAMAIRPILENFQFDKVYTSDLTRAMDTQALALPFEDPIRTPLLREIDVGGATGYPWGQVPNAPEGWSSKTDIRILCLFLKTKLFYCPSDCPVFVGHRGHYICLFLQGNIGVLYGNAQACSFNHRQVV